MKIILLKNSILLISINPTSDVAKTQFFYFVDFFTIKKDKRFFPLSENFSVSNIKTVYEKLANDWDRKYRI